MEKIFIRNRKGERLAVVVEQPDNPRGLAFVMHGLGGFKEQNHIRTIAESFLEKEYTVVTFDAANSFGESDGDYQHATVTNYYKDLEDIVEWSHTQPWFVSPFVLAGHSLGAMCCTLFAQHHPEQVRGLGLTASVISGQLSMESAYHKRINLNWKKTGWHAEEMKSKSGIIKKLPWSHMEDRLKYDLLPKSSELVMPVLIIVGSADDGTPPEHQQLLFQALPERKEMHVIEGADHSFRPHEKYLPEFKQIFHNWIKSL